MHAWTELCCFNTLFLKKMLLFYFCHSFYILISDFFSDKENESYDHHHGVVHVAKEELGRGRKKYKMFWKFLFVHLESHVAQAGFTFTV